MSALLVSADGIPVGTIEIENGRWEFGYEAEWKAYALSPNFPIATGKFEDTMDAKPVEWFFENLLPEGRLRDLIASGQNRPTRHLGASDSTRTGHRGGSFADPRRVRCDDRGNSGSTRARGTTGKD